VVRIVPCFTVGWVGTFQKRFVSKSNYLYDRVNKIRIFGGHNFPKFSKISYKDWSTALWKQVRYAIDGLIFQRVNSALWKWSVCFSVFKILKDKAFPDFVDFEIFNELGREHKLRWQNFRICIILLKWNIFPNTFTALFQMIEICIEVQLGKISYKIFIFDLKRLFLNAFKASFIGHFWPNDLFWQKILWR